MPIGRRLKDARNDLGMTQEELASAVGVTKGAIGNYETDVSSPKETILIKLMNVLHIDPNYLYQDYIKPTTFTDDEVQLVLAFRKANEGTQSSIRKLLDLSNEKNDTEVTAG